MLALVLAQIDGSSARANSARIASRTAAAAPAKVSTLRLCEASDDRSSSRTPGVAATASATASTTSARRPSLMFGTDSMIAMRALLPHPCRPHRTGAGRSGTAL